MIRAEANPWFIVVHCNMSPTGPLAGIASSAISQRVTNVSLSLIGYFIPMDIQRRLVFSSIDLDDWLQSGQPKFSLSHALSQYRKRNPYRFNHIPGNLLTDMVCAHAELHHHTGGQMPCYVTVKCPKSCQLVLVCNTDPYLGYQPPSE